MDAKIEQTKEDQIISWFKNNKSCTFTDIISKFGVNELYSKTFLLRVKQGHIKIE